MNGSKEFGSLVNITKQKLEKWTHTHTISTTRTTKSKKKLVVLSIRRNLIRSIFVLFCSIYLCICAHTFFDLAMQASKPSNHRPHHRFHHHRRISSLNFRFFSSSFRKKTWAFSKILETTSIQQQKEYIQQQQQNGQQIEERRQREGNTAKWFLSLFPTFRIFNSYT